MTSHKFSALVGTEFVPHTYSNTWQTEKTTGPERLVIAPASNQIELMIQLAQVMPEPFGILYVLLVSRTDNEPGRYQSLNPIPRTEMELFMRGFKEYFESDGRHHIWLSSVPDSSLLVYDQHNVIFAYGPLKQFEQILRNQGLERGDVRFPDPHAHNYNPECEQEEQRLLGYWDWLKSPIMPGDNL
ncbi:MAG TPA: hypothetical protein VJS64_19085 [Pyrinomonadaceae bacterium]|nr:hypothetical protein [Pyrinomonadaceae bacterium]